MIKKYDEPILKLLTDIKVKLSDPGEPLSFTLEFHFKPNEYFKNELLTKTYVLKSKLACYDPHPYRGTAIEYATGCDIDWNEGKNVTLRTIKKKQRHRVGEEGKGEEAAAGSGEDAGKCGGTDEDSDSDRPKGLIGYLLDTDFVESLPVKVKCRVLALKKLQTRAAHLESKFLREFHDIERKFAEMYQPLLEKRRQIINAVYEPTEEECEYKSDCEDYFEEEMDEEEETNGNEDGMVHEYVDENDDFLLGHNLRTYIIPRSVLFFSGDALESQQEGVVREVNDEIYDKIIYDDWMAAIEEVKACCKNLEALVEDIDR